MDPFDDFVCIEKPTIPITAYVKELQQLTGDKEMLIAAILIARLIQKTGKVLSLYSIHRLMLTAAIISIKLTRCVSKVNKYFALKGAININELNGMERSFLYLIDWDVHITKEQFEDIRNKAELTIYI